MQKLDKDIAVNELIINARLWQRCFVKEPKNIQDGMSSIAQAVSQVGVGNNDGDMTTACRTVINLLVACEQFMYTVPTVDDLDALLVNVLKKGWPVGNPIT